MCISRGNVNDLKFITVNQVLVHRTAVHRSHADETLPIQNEKLLRLCLVVVISAANAWLGSRYKYLSKVILLDKFCEAPSRVGLYGEFVFPRLARNIGEIRRKERPIEPIGK